MNPFLEVFTKNIIPIFIVAAVGFFLRKRMGLSTKVLSSLTFYALSPALAFSALVNNQLNNGEFLQIAAFAVISSFAMGLIGLVLGTLLRLSRSGIVAVILVLMFANGGNFGLTLNELRYGEEGLARAIVFYVMSTIILFTFGVFLSSMGRSSARESLIRLVKLPAVYAVVLAVVVYTFNINVPVPLMRGIEITGAGAIPVMLIVLGMQIADVNSIEGVWVSIPASLARLLIAPFIAVLVAGLIGLSGLSRSTSIIEASMPTAVFTTILATEFNVRPRLVTSTVAISTLLSAITLPLVITLLEL
ncbi:MAG: AEC family transporter [Anaerolineae bacterium]|nr:MAG: AEC family transporter [Anaerolineae bacterium]